MSVQLLISLQLVGLLAGDKSSDKADFQDHSRKYLAKGYDTLKVNKMCHGNTDAVVVAVIPFSFYFFL